jgi:hypothetical protein
MHYQVLFTKNMTIGCLESSADLFQIHCTIHPSNRFEH